MIRKLVVLAAGLVAVLALASPATAARPAAKPDVKCLQTGLGVLQANGGVAYFAKNGVPLSLIGGEGTAPLSTVLKLHLFQPSLFPWCAR
jgi:hypothetical protein